CHANHMGIHSTIERAKESIFWPGMVTDLTNFVQRCETCNSMGPAQQKEPILPTEVPTRPWQLLSCDLFEPTGMRGSYYMVLSDAYSNYFELNRLSSSATKPVVNALAQHFARHGIPEELRTDNGPCFASSEFRQFMNSWKIRHVTTSPHYHRANGLAESAVKIAQNLLLKANKENRDVNLALLEFRNTPTSATRLSPAQRLFGRRTRTLLPTHPSQLLPELHNAHMVSSALSAEKQRQAVIYNEHSKVLPPLAQQQIVRMRIDDKTQHWVKARVIRELGARSYLLRTEDGREFRRNRAFIRAT